MSTFKFKNVYPEPKYTIRSGRNWIDFGHDNLLPAYLKKLLDYSPTHASILRGTGLFATGDGFKQPTDPNMLMLYNNESSTATTSNGLTDNTMNDVLPRIINDGLVYGAFALKLNWSKDRTSIVAFEYIDVSTVRMDVDEEGVWLSDDWKQYQKEKYSPVWFPKFSKDEKKATENPMQVLYVKMPNCYNECYAKPAYWPSREAIETDQELATYSLNRLRNSFFVSCIIKYPTKPTPEQRDALYEQLEAFYTGADEAGKAMVLFGEGVTFEKFDPSVSPDDFKWIKDTAVQDIKVVHQVSGRGDIFGINQGQGVTFSSNDDLKNEFNVYSKTVIRPIQKTVEDTFNAIAKINGSDLSEKFEIQKFTLFDEMATQKENGTPVTDTKAPVQDLAMNGAQVTAFVDIGVKANAKQLNQKAAAAIIRSSFPSVTEEAITDVVSEAPAEAVVTPATPNTIPPAQ